MTPEEKQKLKRILALTGAYFQREIQDAVLLMYVEDLADLSYEAVAKAMYELRREPGRRFMPIPGDIRAKVNPVLSDRGTADDAANRIMGSFKRHDYNWPMGLSVQGSTTYMAHVDGHNVRCSTFADALTAELGELGKLTLDRMGGYSALFDEWRATNNDSALRAQIRDMASSMMEQVRAGVTTPLLESQGRPPALPPTGPAEATEPQTGAPAKLGDILKKLREAKSVEP